MLPKREPNLRIIQRALPAEIAESLGQIISKLGAILYFAPLFPILHSLDLVRKAADKAACC